MAQNTPLSAEQIAKLNEIAKLPVDQQRVELDAFLKTLTPEQIEFLKQQQQGGGCPFCMIVEGKIPSKKVYEDDTVLAVLDIKPAAKGHILLMPKKHYALLGQMNDQEVGWLFTVANKLSGVAFEGMKAEGTNILAAQGGAAGQFVNHVVVHIIPRWKDDKINIAWEGVQLDDAQMDEIHKTLSGLTGSIGGASSASSPVQTPIQEEPEEVEEVDEKDRVPYF
jgi:histidine triad (HIT) family protein